MLDLTKLDETSRRECAAALQAAGQGAGSMEDAAQKLVDYLYNNLGGPEGENACALVRFYKTHPYRELAPDLQRFAQDVLGRAPETEDMKCLTLLATQGEQTEWNDRAKSNGHKAIPLPSAHFIDRIPMISRLISQFGIDVQAVVRPDPALIVDLEQKTYNVFHVQEAVGSPYIPAQDDFVVPHGVRSVLGFGGVFSSGDLYVVILFSKTPIPRATADGFRELAKAVKEATQPFADGAIFRAA